MKQYIPYEKRSKKEQKKINASRRTTWGPLNPVTRKPENSKAYHRKKAQNWKRELPDSGSFLYLLFPIDTLLRPHGISTEIASINP